MAKYKNLILAGIPMVIVLITFLIISQGWGISPVNNRTVVSKYQGKTMSYARSNKVLRDSARKEQRRIIDSIAQKRKDSVKKVEVKFNTTRDSLKNLGYNLTLYASGKYQHVYGYRPSYSSGSSSYSSGSYTSSSSSGSFRSSSGRSFRGGSRRGGK